MLCTPRNRAIALFQRFRRDRRGSVVPMFALALVPLLGAMGAAVDYSRANSVRTAMQSALDATALMLAKEASTLTTSQLTTKANSYFKALFTRGEAANVQITASFSNPTSSSFKLDMTGQASVDTTFTKVFGKNSLDVKTNAQVVWGMRKLELALALDNTGSMASSNKMENLKVAAKNLINTLKTASKTAGDIKVSIIPFDTTVNLGTAYKDQPWFDWDSILCNGWWGGAWCTANAKYFWEGCVRDRKYPYDSQDDVPGSKNGTLYPATQCGNLATLLPLTYDWTALTNKIDEMNPNGNTNVSIGLAWAWHSLTQSAPLAEAAVPSQDLDKVIIILTDGTNTESWNNASAMAVTNSSHIDARTQLVCSNIKAAGIKVYSVRVIDGNADLLRECATTSTMFYDVQQAGQLNAVFSSIANSLANLHVSK